MQKLLEQYAGLQREILRIKDTHKEVFRDNEIEVIIA